MKQSDIFTLILVAGIGVVVSFFVCQNLLGNPDDAMVRYKTINRQIGNVLAQPDPEVFHSTAINPTVEVYVGDCEDIDQNGILDEMELEACAKVESEGGEDEENGEGDETPEGE